MKRGLFTNRQLSVGVLLVVLLAFRLEKSLALSSLKVAQTSADAGLPLASISTKQEAAIDGAEWASLAPFCEGYDEASCSDIGRMTILCGTLLDTDERVVGIQQEQEAQDSGLSSLLIHPESMARIPRNIKDEVAVSTLIASLSGVYTCSDQTRVVVIGGGDFACFCAKGLAAVDSNNKKSKKKVWLVCQDGKPSQRLPPSIEVLTPSMGGQLEQGFCSYLGSFDALVDTLSDEGRRAENALEYLEEDDLIELGGSGVVPLLEARHGCKRYISTLTASQRIVRDNGLLFGPKQAEETFRSNYKRARRSSSAFLPPTGMGKILEQLMDAGVTYDLRGQYPRNAPAIYRGWNLRKFWELATWPRDAAGGANVRFGLPVLDDLDVLEQETAPAEDNDKEEELNAAAAKTNPFVREIVGVRGLQKDVVDAGEDCLLFLGAKFCRTCKVMTPAYTRMARISAEAAGTSRSTLIYAKTEASGRLGKELGKALDVDSVPTFVMFRKGKLYGSPLSITKLPSKKLDLAIRYLVEGLEWDISAFRDEDNREKQKRSKLF